MRITDTNSDQLWYKLLQSLAYDYKKENPINLFDDDEKRKRFVTFLSDIWKVDLIFEDNDIHKTIIGVDINDEYYSLLILKYTK